MKRCFTILFFAAVALFGQKPAVSRTAMAATESGFDQRIQRLSMDDPFDLLGATRGIYLDGYGVVLTAEVNLIITPGITPFHPSFSKEDKVRIHQRKLQRLEVLKRAMMEELAASAASLDTLPSNEQVVLGVSLFYFSWEDTSGLPRQIVVQASRKALLDAQAGHLDMAALSNAIRVQEL